MRKSWEHVYDFAAGVPGLCYVGHEEVYLLVTPGSSWGSMPLAHLQFKLCENSFRCIERYFGDQ